MLRNPAAVTDSQRMRGNKSLSTPTIMQEQSQKVVRGAIRETVERKMSCFVCLCLKQGVRAEF